MCRRVACWCAYVCILYFLIHLQGCQTKADLWIDYLSTVSRGVHQFSSQQESHGIPLYPKVLQEPIKIKIKRERAVYFEWSNVWVVDHTEPPPLFLVLTHTAHKHKMKEVWWIDRRNLPPWSFCDVWAILQLILLCLCVIFRAVAITTLLPEMLSKSNCLHYHTVIKYGDGLF